ncbi:MAG TPA: hypothetical protein PKM25_03715 [Candidatus Ozemobacteraceae bacterium]|nr:hypothetical protein [Candidatus Ozemobacteraceae bacterium]
MVIVVLIGVLTVLAIFFFSLATHSQRLRATTVNFLDEEFAFEIAQSAASVYWSELEDVFRERSGSSVLFPHDLSRSPLNFYTSDLNGFTLHPADLDAETNIQNAFAELVKPFSEVKVLGAEVRFRVSNQSSDGLTGFLDMKVQVQVKRSSYEFTFPRDFKLTNILPFVPSKFTLFVKNCPDPEMFNIVKKGFQQNTGPQKILVLHNTEQAFSSTAQDVWKKSGWIFLGGSKVVINLDGTHPSRKESEFFLFWPTIYFGSGNQNSEIPYSCSPPFKNTNLCVRVMPTGCCSDWSNPAAGLNNVVGNTVAESVESSSMLRLFGDKSHITPTRILGNVFVRYVLYSTLIFDSNNDGVADFISDSTGTPQKAVFPLPRSSPKEYSNPRILPRMMSAGGFDLFIDGEGVPGVPDSLADILPSYSAGAPNDYVNFMTKLSTDFLKTSEIPFYNSLYDHVFDWSNSEMAKSFPAKKILSQSGKEYPNPGTEFSLPSDQQGGGSLWSGNLNDYDPTVGPGNPMKWVGYQFATQDEFLANAPVKQVSKTIFLAKPMIAHISGDLDLSPAVEVSAPTVLIVSGKIRIGKVHRATPAGKLILLSLTGDIETAGGKIEACLMAPKGTIRLLAPLDLVGTLLLGTLDPAQVSGFGGSIFFDSNSDPTNPEVFGRYFSVFLGPHVTSTLKKQ